MSALDKPFLSEPRQCCRISYREPLLFPQLIRDNAYPAVVYWHLHTSALGDLRG